MPFIPAVIGAALIGTGGSIASGIIGSKAQKNATKAMLESPLTQEQTRLARQQADYGKQAGDLAGRLLPQYEEGTNYLADYFKKFLGPDIGPAMEAASPLINARKRQTAGLVRSLDFAPRGGGRGESLFNLYSNESSDIFNLLNTERQNARQGYAGLIGDIGARGSGLLGAASGSSGSAASTLGLIQANAQQAGRVAGANVANTAGSIGAALGPLLVEWIKSSRGK